MFGRMIGAKTLLRRTLHPAVVALLLAIVAPFAGAQSLDRLRADGVVGERYDGYAVVRESSAPASVRKFVSDVNEKRRRVYETRAKEQNVPVGQVGRVYAKELFERLPKGSWFLDEAGRWVKK